MSEKRKAALRITVKDATGKLVKIELFEAALWDPASTGLYRIRIAGKWRMAGGSQYDFYSFEEFTEVLNKSLTKLIGEKGDESA